MDKAMNMIKMIVEPLVVGDDYKGKVVRSLTVVRSFHLHQTKMV